MQWLTGSASSSASAAANVVAKEKEKEAPKASPTLFPNLVAKLASQGGKKTTVEHDFARALMMKNKQLFGGKGKAHSKGHTGVFRGNIVNELGIATNASGVYQNIFGDTSLSTAPDFASFSALFDISCCTGIFFHYQPIAGGSVPPSTSVLASGTHVPVLACYDPEALAAVTYGTLAGSRDWTDKKNNQMWATSAGWSHHFKTPKSKKVVNDNGSSVTASLGDWVDNLIYTTGRIDGAVLMAIYNNTVNVNANLGRMIIVYEMEWAYRL